MILVKEKAAYPANGDSLKLDVARCTGCGLCIEVCPHAVFETDASQTNKVTISARGRCMECGACSTNCPAKAITVAIGVGCVAAIIQGKLKGTAPSCDCGGGNNSCC